jgi:serine/threonine-protein kinase
VADPEPSERFRRLKALFEEALEHPPADRAAFIGKACGADDGLAAELRGLLEAHGNDGGFLEEIVSDGARGVVPMGSPGGTLRGRFGVYEILEEIGSGGMGSVFLARRADSEYEAKVAVKIVRPGLFSTETLRRFRAERQALALLAHPGIARLLDGGTTQDGVPYLVMEHVEGLPIDAFAEGQKLDLASRIRLLRLVCAAVQYAHASLIVHRDIKPANILVTREGDPKLLDFGIAKFLGEEDPRLTRVGERVLTPDYASPEQIRGEPITTATDVYSLGVVLYRLLTGRPPYSFPSGRSSEIERIVCEREPEPPRLSEDLDRILGKALAKEPQRRYASVVELSEDLRRYLADEPVAARPDTLAYRASKFLQRHRVGTAATAVVLAALAAGLGVALASAAAARREARKAEQINAFVQEVLGAANPWKDGSQITVAEVLDRASSRIGTDLAGQPEVEAGVRRTVGETYSGLGMYDKAEPQLRRAIELLRSARGGASDEVADALLALSAVLVSRGDPKQAEAPAREALAMRERLHGSSDVSVGRALTALGNVLQAGGELDAAEAVERRAVEILRKSSGADAGLAEALNNLAVTLGTKGDLAAAEPLQREALAVIRRAHPDPHPDVASAMSALAATVWDSKRDFAEADTLFQETLAMRRQLLGADHPDVAWTLYNYAYMQMEQGDLARAEALAREGLANRGKTLPDEHPMVAATLQLVGRCRLGQDDPGAAEPFLRESLELRRHALPEGHWLLASGESLLGESIARQGRAAEARPLLESGHAGLSARFGAESPRAKEAKRRLELLPKTSP